MEMCCYRRLLGISYREHRPNGEVRSIITAAIGQHKDLLQIVKERKLKWNGHVTRDRVGKDYSTRDTGRRAQTRKAEKKMAG